LKFYWLLLEKTSEDGRRIIVEEKDTNATHL
jgi:hypothetical protein